MPPIIIEDFEDEEFYFNKPLGLAYKRYGHVWKCYMEDALEQTGTDDNKLTAKQNYQKRLARQEELLSQGYEGMTTITKETLPMFFNSHVTSWEELLKILKAFQKSDFKYPVKDAFTVEHVNKDTIILKLKAITPEIARKYDKN